MCDNEYPAAMLERKIKVSQSEMDVFNEDSTRAFSGTYYYQEKS